LLSTQEIEELDVADIEQFIWANPQPLGNDVKPLKRQQQKNQSHERGAVIS